MHFAWLRLHAGLADNDSRIASLCVLVIPGRFCKAGTPDLLIPSSCLSYVLKGCRRNYEPLCGSWLPACCCKDVEQCQQRDCEDARSNAIAACAFHALQAPGQLLTRADNQDSNAEGQSWHQYDTFNVLQAPGRALTAAEDSDSDAEGDDLGDGSAMGGMYDAEEMEVSLEDEEALAAFMVSFGKHKNSGRAVVARIYCAPFDG